MFEFYIYFFCRLLYNANSCSILREKHPFVKSFTTKEEISMNKKKRTVSLLLALLMLTSATMVSCSDGTENSEDVSDNTPAVDTQIENAEETEPEELTPAEQRALIPDELPDQTFGGRSYIVAVAQNKEFEIRSEELTGEATNDAVYDRNIRIEDRFDVKIEAYIPSAATYDDVKTVVTSGTYAYDVVGFQNYKSSVPIMAGVLYNWCEMPHVNLEKPWHNQLANDPATINGKLYALNSDLSISTLQYTYGMFFNYDIWDRYGVSSQDFYDMVFDGTWTVEKMQSMTTEIWEDTNGNGIHDRDDIHGYSVYLGLNNTDVWLAAFDLDVATINDDGTFEITFFNEKTVNALEKAIALSYDKNGYINTVSWRDVPDAFAEGKIAMTQLYFGETTESLGEMEDTYGILPLPKFDENQEGYYTNAWDTFSVYAVPLTVADDDLDVTGIIFEALCAESYKTVFPAYYDQALKSRYSAEPATAEIIDLIMAGRKLEFTFQFGENLSSLPYMFRQMLASKSTDIASTYKKQQKSLNKVMQRMLNIYFEE